MTILYEKADECPGCNATTLAEGFNYDGQTCTRCGWGITPDVAAQAKTLIGRNGGGIGLEPLPCLRCGNMPELDYGPSDNQFEQPYVCCPTIVTINGEEQHCPQSAQSIEAWNWQAWDDVPAEGLELICEILDELTRARTKFPGQNVTLEALVEEVVELATATSSEPRANVRKEAVQVAVMAMRMVLDGDHTFDAWRTAQGLDALVEVPV